MVPRPFPPPPHEGSGSETRFFQGHRVNDSFVGGFWTVTGCDPSPVHIGVTAPCLSHSSLLQCLASQSQPAPVPNLKHKNMAWSLLDKGPYGWSVSVSSKIFRMISTYSNERNNRSASEMPFTVLNKWPKQHTEPFLADHQGCSMVVQSQ